MKIFGKKKYGNTQWTKGDNKWYSFLHEANNLLHQDFSKYYNSKNDLKSILEIGCGTGVYPIKHSEFFKNKEYTGIDFSQENIEFCKQNSNFEFVFGDFIKMDLDKKYDLVYSLSVIDHVYDIDEFLRRIVSATKKYAYINAYRGYFPNLKSHKTNWRDDDNCYYNDLSIERTKQVLLDSGLTAEEFIIRKHDNGYEYDDPNGKKWYETIIEIKRLS